MFKTKRSRFFLALLGLFALIQLVPYGRDHKNPPVSAEPRWDSPETRRLAERTCFNCHSNKTMWPWYSHIAPFSWLVQHDVEEARSLLNFSEWDRPQEEAEEAGDMVREGKMPLWYYVLGHPEADLSSEEKNELIRGLQATIGGHEREGEEGELE